MSQEFPPARMSPSQAEVAFYASKTLLTLIRALEAEFPDRRGEFLKALVHMADAFSIFNRMWVSSKIAACDDADDLKDNSPSSALPRG